MTIKGYIDTEKAKANFEHIVTHVKQLPRSFLDANRGESFAFLHRLAHTNSDVMFGKPWGNPEDSAMLCILCAYYGIVQDNLKALGFKAECLNETFQKVTYIAFNVDDEFLNLVRHNLGLTSIVPRGGLLGGLKKALGWFA
jgi:hypothetical protein